MTEHPFFFKGIGSYNPETGAASYNVILPKIEGLVFRFETNSIQRIQYQGKDCLMIFTHNGRDDDNYGTTPEVVNVQFTIDNVQEFEGKPITMIINHDADMENYSEKITKPHLARKPGSLGLGTIDP